MPWARVREWAESEAVPSVSAGRWAEGAGRWAARWAAARRARLLRRGAGVLGVALVLGAVLDADPVQGRARRVAVPWG